MRHKLYERIGKFVIAKEVMDSLPDWLQQLMARVIVLRTDYLPWRDGTEFTALSPEFEKCNPACIPPEYMAIMDDGRFLRWERA